MRPMKIPLLSSLAAALLLGAVGTAIAAPAPLKPCRVEGVPNELQCGSVRRALDPARPDGPQIDVHYLVVPAMARNKRPDAVLFLAGGPGQSAIDVAPKVLELGFEPVGWPPEQTAEFLKEQLALTQRPTLVPHSQIWPDPQSLSRTHP